MSFTFFWFLYSLPETYLPPFYTVSIVSFEHVFAGNIPFTISSRIPSVKGNIQLRKKSRVSFSLSKIPSTVEVKFLMFLNRNLKKWQFENFVFYFQELPNLVKNLLGEVKRISNSAIYCKILIFYTNF